MSRQDVRLLVVVIVLVAAFALAGYVDVRHAYKHGFHDGVLHALPVVCPELKEVK